MFLLQNVNWSLESIVIIGLLNDILLWISLDQMIWRISNLLILEGKRLVLRILRISEWQLLFYLLNRCLLVRIVNRASCSLISLWNGIIRVGARTFVLNVSILSCHYRILNRLVINVDSVNHLRGLSCSVNSCIDVKTSSSKFAGLTNFTYSLEAFLILLHQK